MTGSFPEGVLGAWVSETLPATLDTKRAASFTTDAGPRTYVTARCACVHPFKGADRRGARAYERAVDDLAVHCAEHHEHPDAPIYVWGLGSDVDSRDIRWWWRGYLAAHLAPDDVPQPRYSNSGGAQGRLKMQWRKGWEAAGDEQ